MTFRTLSKKRKTFPVGEINAGEIFGLSSLIEPYIFNATGTAAVNSRFIAIEANALRALMEMDCHMGYVFMRQVAKVVMEQLAAVRIQLAAAWA